MQATTKQDILNNLPTIRGYAYDLLGQEMQGEDWWATLTINGLGFDLNVFLWDEDGEAVVNVTAHPMYTDTEGYWQTDMSNFVPVLRKILATGAIGERV